MAGGHQAFGGQQEKKGCPRGAEHRPAPSALIQRAGQLGAARGRALLAGGGSGFPQKLRSSLPAGLAGLGNFKQETNPNRY